MNITARELAERSGVSFRQFSVLKALMVCPLAAHKRWLAFGRFWRLPASNSSALPMTGPESAFRDPPPSRRPKS